MARKKSIPLKPALPLEEAVNRAVSLAEQAELLYRQQQYQPALETVQRAIDLIAPHKKARPQGLHLLKAHCLQHVGQFDGAVAAARQELAITPEAKRPHVQLMIDYFQSPAIRSGSAEVLFGGKLQFSGETAPQSWPSVSLCMIVKNEEAHLADCLRSVGDVASEIIIVDTGSTDRTVAIAASFGARVEHFMWINDFAAARNESIRHASGDWIFWMDADDRLSPDNLIRLKQALTSGLADVYMCYVTSRVTREESNIVDTKHARLFPNRAGLYFERPLHEDVIPVARRQGLTVAQTNITIAHVGYAVSDEDLKQKAERNLPIIEQMLAQNPADMYWLYHRAVGLHMKHDFSAANEVFEQVLATPTTALNKEMELYQAHVSLIANYFNLKQPDKAEAALQRALKDYPHRRHLRILGGTMYLVADKLEAAIELLGAACHLPPETDTYGVNYPPGQAELHLARAYLLAGNLPRARATYFDMLGQMDKATEPVPPALLAQAERLIAAGQHDAAYHLLEPVTTTDAAAWRLLSGCNVRRQAWAKAARALENAVILSAPQPGEWVKLAEYVLNVGNLHMARAYCRRALSDQPQDVDALNMLGIIAFKAEDVPAAIEKFVAALLINPGYSATGNNLGQVAAAMKITLPALLMQYGRQLLAQQQLAEALQLFSTALNLYPAEADFYKLQAAALQKMGREEEAVEIWRMSQQIAAQPLLPVTP